MVIGILKAMPGASIFIIALVVVSLSSGRPLTMVDMIVRGVNSAVATLAILLLVIFVSSRVEFYLWDSTGIGLGLAPYTQRVPWGYIALSLSMFVLGGTIGTYRGNDVGKGQQLACVSFLSVILFFGALSVAFFNVSGDAGLGVALIMAAAAPTLIFAIIGWAIGGNANVFEWGRKERNR
jgi:hypothetical protein